jgi:heme-degrading monooxygenase HmoA
MTTEIAMIGIGPGREDAFVLPYPETNLILTCIPGCISARMTRGIESPSRFVGIIEWEFLETHTVNFRGTERGAVFAGLSVSAVSHLGHR